MSNKNVLTVPTHGLSSSNSGGYSRRESNFLTHAELAFDDMTFVVAGKGKEEKVILNNVGAKITNGRKLNGTKHLRSRQHLCRYCLITNALCSYYIVISTLSLINIDVVALMGPSGTIPFYSDKQRRRYNQVKMMDFPLNFVFCFFFHVHVFSFFFQVLERRRLFRP